MRRSSAIRLTIVAAAAIAALPLAPIAAQFGGDSREACRRAASVLVNQEARWDDAPNGARGLSNSLNWRAADGTFGNCSVDSKGRVYAVRVERWGAVSGDIDVWPGTGSGNGVRTLICESDKGRRRECSIPRGAMVRLLDRISDSPCTYGRSWGFTRSEIWVTGGCRAAFEVRW
ncbi:MAG: DUF3011 domain-containing protein [Thermoanaerobaculia bacterium]